ncbi:hypothetical protein [Priestia taiwanensis]|uniref:Uncharacterized protein n=1 Tax=Priestia taiwanensis TaxID=1347902 RepID=A0A917ESD2_9BACI|nr:hypothetical protein [Priestia taiwanensis]MBM7365036.1 hypothetical protein [Priestia taiwanensis]GGE83565.1 hypothetical protein GCM10007140_36350 [Priestia taiwanensis]
MNYGCCRDNNEIPMITIEGDMGGDPIWCTNCGCNLDIDKIPLGKELKVALWQWMHNYGKWIDWETDTLLPNATEQERLHNKKGQKLTWNVQQALNGEYIVTFKPSTSVELYTEIARFDMNE